MRHQGIGFKITATSVILAILFFGISFGFTIFKVQAVLFESKTFAQQILLQGKQNEIDTVLHEVQVRLRSLSGTPPFQGIIRTEQSEDGVDILDGSTEEQWIKRLQSIFVSEVNAGLFYDQLRYINEDGYEIVRVDYIDGQAQIVPEEKLQNKSNRDYFIEASLLGKNQIYISDANLNREGDPPQISVPHRPVIRYAVPIYSSIDGGFKGILIANILLDTLFSFTEDGDGFFSNFYIIDSHGYFIMHPDESKEWGGKADLDSGTSFVSEFPELADVVAEQNEGSLIVGDTYYVYTKLYYDTAHPTRFLTIVQELPLDIIYGPIFNIILGALATAIVSFIVFGLFFRLFIHRLLKPMQDLVDGVEKVSHGNTDIQIPVRTQDEIGLVAQAFNSMVKNIKKYYTSLEERVEKRTKSLNIKVEELEDTRKAMIGLLEDVELEKEKAKHLAQDLEKFKLAVENANDHVIITDAEGVIIYANAAVKKITGFSKKEVLGKKAGAKELWGGLMEPAFYKKMWETIKVQKQPFAGEITNKKKSGEKYYALTSIAPVLNVAGEVEFFVAIERDVTQEKMIDQAKTEFVSLASHQLRTPLSSINWYVEMLLAGDAGSITKDQKKFLEEIYNGSQRMVELVNALLNVSRLELGTFVVEPQETDIIALARSVLDEQKMQIDEKKLHVTPKLDTTIEQMMVDPKLLRMVFQNLVSNAVKYTPESGAIEFEISKDVEKEVIHVCVSDNGMGIPKDQQSMIFKKLFRADNVKEADTEGTGLGLYIVKSIIEHSGGRVWFDSEENKGTAFHIELPLCGMVAKEGTKSLS